MSFGVKTSKNIKFFGLMTVVWPILYLAICFSVFEIDFSGILKLILSPWYWIISALSVWAGFGILKIRWYGWYLFLFNSLVFIYQTAVALTYYSSATHKFPLFLIFLGIQILVVILIAREIRVPYYFPRIRWWESDPRFKLSVNTKIFLGHEERQGEIMDLSRSGCFIKAKDYYIPNDLLRLEFSLFDQVIQCAGSVVWRAESTITHPKGIGVKFSNLTRENLHALKRATRTLRKLAQEHNQKTREKNWEEYISRENQYQNKNPGPSKK